MTTHITRHGTEGQNVGKSIFVIPLQVTHFIVLPLNTGCVQTLLLDNSQQDKVVECRHKDK